MVPQYRGGPKCDVLGTFRAFQRGRHLREDRAIAKTWLGRGHHKAECPLGIFKTYCNSMRIFPYFRATESSLLGDKGLWGIPTSVGGGL